jgi:hypothetical protein
MARSPIYPAIPRLKDDSKSVRALREAVETLQRQNTKYLPVSGSSSVAFFSGGSSEGEDNYPVPQIPTGFEVTSGYGAVYLEWNANQELGYAYTEIYRASSNSFSESVRVGTSIASIAADPLDAGQVAYYWVRHVNKDGDQGPLSGTSGLMGQTAIPPEYLLDQLNGQITRTQLVSALNAKIDEIAVNAFNIIALDENLETEVTARIGTDQRVSAAEGDIFAIDNKLLIVDDTLNDQSAAILEQQEIVSGENGLEAQYIIKTDVNGLVSGIGLYNDGLDSAFVINVNKFGIYSPNAESLSFGVSNGKVVMDWANIANAVITNAQIQSVAVDKIIGDKASFVTANIGNGAITNAMIGNLIQSSTYSSTYGWRIHKDGTAIFRNIFARGNIEASSITAGSVNIIDTLMVKGQAITFSQGSRCSSGSTSSNKKLIYDGTFNPQGGRLQLIFTATVDSADGGLEAQIYINGEQKSRTKARIRASNGATAYWELPLSLQYTTGSASTSQRVQIYMEENGYQGNWKDAYLTATELKR